jgi:hypothetical protein
MTEPDFDEKVEVPPDGLLRLTGQLWKVIVGGVVVPVPLAIFSVALIQKVGRQTREEFWTDTLILIVGAVAIAIAFAAVRCPRCNVWLMRSVFGAPDGTRAIVAFLKLRACPACSFEPRRENRAG